MPPFKTLSFVLSPRRHVGPSDGLNTRDPIAELETWLSRLPPRLTLTRARALATRLESMAQVSYNVRTHLKLLEMLDDTLLELCSDIEAQLDLSTLPLPRRIQDPLVATLSALKRLSKTYLDMAERINQRWVKFGFTRPLATAIARGTQAATRRLALGHRAYTISNSSTWRYLYRFHQLAREQGIATQPAGRPGTLNIEQTYAHALLLAAADPTCIAPGDLDRIRFYLQRHVHLTRMFQAGEEAERIQREATGLLVVRSGGRPPTPLSRLRHPLRPDQWLLDPRDLLLRLQQQIDGLRLGVMPIRLGLPLAARQSRYVLMLETLREHWSNPRSRTHARTRFLPRTDLVVGFEAARTFMSGMRSRRHTDPPGNTPLTPHESTSEWGILDESPGGFGLRYLSGQAHHVRVGELVAIRPRERALAHLCVVRRAVNRGAIDFDLGLEVVAGSAIATEVQLPDAFGRGLRAVPVLLIPKLPMQGGAALIAEIDDVPPGTQITLLQQGQRLTLRTGVSIEKFRALEVLPLKKA